MPLTDAADPSGPTCEHCDAPLEAGRMTCAGCGAVRSLGVMDDAPPPAAAPAPQAAPADDEADDEGIDLSVSIFRDAPRRKPRAAAERSHTSLLVGGFIGLVLVALVAAAALWALSQNSATGS